MGNPSTFLCACLLYECLSPYLIFYSLRKIVWGEFLIQYLRISYIFLKTTGANLNFWVQRLDNNCEKSSAYAAGPNLFYTKSYGPPKRQTFDFSTVFSNFLTFLESNPPISKVLVSIGRTGCLKLLCMSGYVQLVLQKFMTLRKIKFMIF